jgi:hypothetical protein
MAPLCQNNSHVVVLRQSAEKRLASVKVWQVQTGTGPKRGSLTQGKDIARSIDQGVFNDEDWNKMEKQSQNRFKKGR